MFFINSETSHQNVLGNFFFAFWEKLFLFQHAKMFSHVGTQGNIDRKDNISDYKNVFRGGHTGEH